MAIEQSLYAQVVNLLRKDLKFVPTDKNQNEAKFKFQGKPERSQLLLDLDLDWIEINFSTSEPDIYKKLFQSHDNTHANNTIKNSSTNWKCEMCRIV